MVASCSATLNYVAASPDRAPAPRDVIIEDGRLARLPGWEVCGFELLGHSSAVDDWHDAATVASVHYAEVEQLARELTGCDHAIVSNHITRSPEQAARHRDLGPIRFVHSDFASGHDDLLRQTFHDAVHEGITASLTRNGLTADALDHDGRIVILQFWRNTGPVRMDLPLAWCDARTIGPEETQAFVVADYAGAGGGDFEALAVTAPGEPGRHRWYWFPDLGVDEVVAFRTYDTDLVRAGRTFFTPHTAFRDPAVPLGDPARCSIELRATCVFT